jgi:drug/metabolite transporter (DMT)-like permease
VALHRSTRLAETQPWQYAGVVDRKGHVCIEATTTQIVISSGQFQSVYLREGFMFSGLGLGIVYVLISNISFAVNTVSARRGMLSGSALQGVYLSVLLGMPIFLVAAFITTQVFDFRDIAPGRYGVLAAAGILHFLFGRYCNYRALGILGANRANPLVQSNAFFSQ